MEKICEGEPISSPKLIAGLRAVNYPSWLTVMMWTVALRASLRSRHSEQKNAAASFVSGLLGKGRCVPVCMLWQQKAKEHDK